MATLRGFEPVRTFTFLSVAQRGTIEPEITAAETTASRSDLYDTLVNVINTVARPDSKSTY